MSIFPFLFSQISIKQTSLQKCDIIFLLLLYCRQSQAYMQQLALFNNTLRSQRFALPLTNPSLNARTSFPSPRAHGPLLHPPALPLIKQNHSSEQKFITSPLHAIASNGGLGNQLFELISLIGIGRTLNRQPIITANNGIVLSILSSKKGPMIFLKRQQLQAQYSLDTQ